LNFPLAESERAPIATLVYKIKRLRQENNFVEADRLRAGLVDRGVRLCYQSNGEIIWSARFKCKGIVDLEFHRE
jgi:cysteinyl-tRNA synthetase